MRCSGMSEQGEELEEPVDEVNRPLLKERGSTESRGDRGYDPGSQKDSLWDRGEARQVPAGVRKKAAGDDEDGQDGKGGLGGGEGGGNGGDSGGGGRGGREGEGDDDQDFEELLYDLDQIQGIFERNLFKGPIFRQRQEERFTLESSCDSIPGFDVGNFNGINSHTGDPSILASSNNSNEELIDLTNSQPLEPSHSYPYVTGENMALMSLLNDDVGESNSQKEEDKIGWLIDLLDSDEGREPSRKTARSSKEAAISSLLDADINKGFPC